MIARLVAVWAALWTAVPALAADVVVWHAYRDAEATALRDVADAWTQRSGKTVELVPVGFDVFDSKVETAVPRGNGPDLLISAHSSLGKWVAMGLLQEVAGTADGHRPVTVDALTHEGKLWGLPLSYKSVMLFYDPSVVSAAPQTTDELVEAATRLSEPPRAAGCFSSGGGGRYGLAYEAASPYFHAAWMHGYGATLVGDEPVRLDAPEHVRALGFVKRLQDDGLLPQRPTSQLVSSLYEAEKAAFVISGPWFVGSVTRPLVAAPLPIVSETGEPARPYLTVEGVFLADQAANASDARAFARFLSEEGAQARQDVGGQAVSLEGVTTDDPILRVQHQQAAVAIPMPTDPNVQSIWEAQARSLRRVLRGAATPEEAGVGAQEYMQALSRPPPQEAAMWPYALLLALLGAGALALFGNQVRKVEVRYAVASHWRDYLWVGPATVAMAVLVVLPFVTGAGVAFYAHHQGEWTFVGVQHFIDILTSRDWPVTSPMSFFYTLGVTILWTITNVFLHVSIGVALALILREPWIRLRGVWRALLILPWAVPNYITALIWKTMFDAQYGAINSILTLALFQSEPIELDWFGSFSTAFTANLVTNTWLGFPFMMVVTLGALQAIPRDLEEAAEVDGAGPVARFRHVTWPLLRPALMPAVVLGSIWTFNMFNIVYLVSGGEPDGATEILISEAYRWAFSRGNQYGYAAAYAVIIFGVLLVYSRGANRLAGRRVV